MDEVKIIADEKDYLIILKPAGVLVHSDKSQKSREGEPLTLAEWIINNFPKLKNIGDDPEIRPAIVHRLDKDTSGVMVIPKTQEVFDFLKNLFQRHEVKKTYLALVWGQFKNKVGTIDKKIYLKPGSVKRSVFGGKMGKEAVTEYEVLKEYELPDKKGKKQFFSLVKVFPKTGRTHQIRVHLASISHPIVGDPLYGKKENPFGAKQQFLHALSLEFSGSDGRRIRAEAPIFGEFRAAVDVLEQKA